MDAPGLFALNTVLGYGLSGAITTAALLRWNDRLALPAPLLLFAGFGAGPWLITLVLYYAMLLWPGVPASIALALVLTVFMALAIAAGGRGIRALGQLVQRGYRSLRGPWSLVLLFGSLAVLGIGLLFLELKPLVDHDVLEYAVQGKIFLRDRAIHYVPHRVDAATGFCYVGLHGFSFPLLFTWEGLVDGVFGTWSDTWARSNTVVYGWLLIALSWTMLRQRHAMLAATGIVSLTAALGFIFLFMVYHLDSYRIFLETCAVGGFVAVLQVPSRDRMLLFGLLAGAAAFAHSVCTILGGLQFALLALLLPLPMIRRATLLGAGTAAMLLAGGIHYVLDVFLGTGWIFKDIIWF